MQYTLSHIHTNIYINTHAINYPLWNTREILFIINNWRKKIGNNKLSYFLVVTNIKGN